MIEINLLPLERRPVERTPLPRFLLLVVGVVLITLELFYGAYLWVIEVPKTRSELRDVQRTRADMKEEADKVDELENEIDQLSARHRAVINLVTERNKRIWSPVLDQLDEPEVLPEQVWLTKFDFKPPQRNQPGIATLRGYVRGSGRERMDVLSLFLRNIQENDYFSRMFPDIKLKEFEVEELNPSEEASSASARNLPTEALLFEVELTMQVSQPEPAGKKKK